MQVLRNHRIGLLLLTVGILSVATAGAGVVSDFFSPVTDFFNSKVKIKVSNPFQQKNTGFNHRIHLNESLGCAECHDMSDKEEAKTLPLFKSCEDCHEQKEVAAVLSGLDSKMAKAEGKELIFSHETHISADVDCTRCHVGIKTNENLSAMKAVRMNDCITCHLESDDNAAQSCSTCHSEISKDKAPDFHKGRFPINHGDFSKKGSDESKNNCSLCHTQSDCTSCHQTQAPKSHNIHFKAKGHGIRATMDRESCSTCHQEDSCASCHQVTAPRSHTGNFAAPKNKHCVSCHLPLASSGCANCHQNANSHAMATPTPTNTAHIKASSQDCRECHTFGKLKHEDAGHSCRECHR